MTLPIKIIKKNLTSVKAFLAAKNKDKTGDDIYLSTIY